MTSGPVPTSGFKEYAAAGALLTGVIAWFPLAASWFYAVGFTYYDTLMERVGLNASTLGSGLVDYSQKMTVAARAMAEKKTVGQRS